MTAESGQARAWCGMRNGKHCIVLCQIDFSAPFSFNIIVHSELALQPGQDRHVLHAAQRAEDIERRVCVAVSLVELVLCAATPSRDIFRMPPAANLKFHPVKTQRVQETLKGVHDD
jgi:hypothetical protein